MTYSVTLSPGVVKTLDRLDQRTEERIIKRMEELADNPFDPRVSKLLVKAGGKRSARVGDWRVIYLVDVAAATINVLAVRPRGRAYRDI